MTPSPSHLPHRTFPAPWQAALASVSSGMRLPFHWWSTILPDAGCHGILGDRLRRSQDFVGGPEELVVDSVRPYASQSQPADERPQERPRAAQVVARLI